jgi:hypothetical protein
MQFVDSLLQGLDFLTLHGGILHIGVAVMTVFPIFAAED